MVKKIKPVSRIIIVETDIEHIAGEVLDRKKNWIGPEDGWMPAVDVSENDCDITVKVELPGVSQGDIRLLLDANRLEIKGIKKEAPGKSRVSYHRLEREYGPFRRIVFLPSSVDPESTKAVLANGVLSVTFRKYSGKEQGAVILKIKKTRKKITENNHGQQG
jgi:HSP20 family molecular chaperone IbpA